MKIINFIGNYDKFELMLYVAKVVKLTQNASVLIIDSNATQKARCLIPAILNDDQYITTFEEMDIAVGFNNQKEIVEYLQEHNDDFNNYDYVFIDMNTKEMCSNFDSENPNISFASNLLAASIGVSEKEMLTIGIQIGDSSNRISQFVNSKISRDIVNSYSVYEHSLKRIYIQMLYGSILQNPIDTKRAVSELFISAYEMASSQISLDNSPFSRGTVSEIEYRIRKMEVLINNALNRFSEPTGIITAEDADEISKSLIQFKQRLINQRDGIRVIQVQGESIPDKD